MVEYLPRKHKALSSNPVLKERKERKSLGNESNKVVLRCKEQNSDSRDWGG
jgi:hypothetical protein